MDDESILLGLFSGYPQTQVDTYSNFQIWRLTMAPAYQEGMKRFGLCNWRLWGEQGRPLRQGGRGDAWERRQIIQFRDFVVVGNGARVRIPAQAWACWVWIPCPHQRRSTQAFLSAAVVTRGGRRREAWGCQQSEFNSSGQTPYSFAMTMIFPLVWDSSPASAWYEVWVIGFLSSLPSTSVLPSKSCPLLVFSPSSTLALSFSAPPPGSCPTFTPNASPAWLPTCSSYSGDSS